MEYPFSHLNLRRFLVWFLFIVPAGLSGQTSDPISQSQQLDSVKHSFSLPILNPKYGTLEEYVQIHQENPSEKIFLHSDRTIYMQGDTIWFKAYLWYGYDQVPDTTSGVLHVDLISLKGNIVIRRKLLIQNGTAHGEISLDTTIIPGSYFLRAYTRLMQNANSGEPFYQTVMINPVHQNFQFECTPAIIKQIRNDSLKIGMRFFEIDAAGDLNKNYNHVIHYTLKIGEHLLTDSIVAENSEEHVLKYSLSNISKQDSIADLGFSIHDNHLTFEKQFHIPLQENIDLQFFPEGGNLVDGLASKVAFKAIGRDGLSRDVTGEIKTGDEKVVSGFKSTNKGMGFFMLKPQSEMEYFAHFWYNNQKYIVPLPKTSKEGSVMSVSLTENSIDPILSIRQNLSGTITPKYITGSSYGKIWFSALVKTFKDSCGLQIPMELIPEGVCRLTVLNSVFEPECERLIYVDKNQRFKIEVIPDSSSYTTRSRVTLLISTTDQYEEPVATDLSLAVVDKDQILKLSEAHGISTYKLLESELKGYIEDADSYFKNDSCINQGDMDLLLLTQGYRKFLPHNTCTGELKFLPEKSFWISGKISLQSGKSSAKKNNFQDVGLTLISITKEPYVGLSHPDSLGRFRFQIPLISGKPHLLLQATTAKKKPYGGDILLDNPLAPPKLTARLPVISNLLSPSIEFISRLQTVKKTEISNITLPGSMSKTLGEVVVTAKVDSKNWWRNYDKDAIKISDLDSLDPDGNRYKNFNDLLIQEFGAVKLIDPDLNTVFLPCIQTINLGFSGMLHTSPLNVWFPIYIVDGRIFWNGSGFDYSPLRLLSVFPVNEIKKIEVIPPMKNISIHYAYEPIVGYPCFIFQSMVVIETYSKNIYRGDPQGVKTFLLDGLDEPRAFYSPRYDGSLRNSPVYDGRATLYWEPSIRTDKFGQAKVDFFTGDRKTSLRIIVNGIEVESGSTGEGHGQINLNVR
jgi:hypothetical protein